jgi:MFS family permease
VSTRGIAYALGSMTGAAIVVLAPVVIGYVVAGRLNKRREGYSSVRWPIITGAIVSLLALAGTCAPKDRNPAAANPAAAGDTIQADVQRKKLPAGATFKTDPQSLKQMQEKAELLIAQSGKASSSDRSFTFSVLPNPAHEIVLQRSWHRTRLINSQLLAVRNGEMVGVNCTTSTEDVPPTFKGTVCAIEANKALGIDVSTIPGNF